jgi:hypothetical protein
MQRFSLITITAACLLAMTAFAGGAVDKITGEFTRAGCNGCEPGDDLLFVANRILTAHEASDKHPQKGFLFSWNDSGNWFEMDFTDTHNTCVNVHEDGRARAGGLVHAGNGPQVGRYFGIIYVDAGEPAYFFDHGATVRISTDYWSEAARVAFQDWCATGNLTPLPGLAVWPGITIEGNFKVHNSPADGD